MCQSYWLFTESDAYLLRQNLVSHTDLEQLHNTKMVALTFNGIMKPVQAGSQLRKDSWGAALWQGILTNTWDT